MRHERPKGGKKGAVVVGMLLLCLTASFSLSAQDLMLEAGESETAQEKILHFEILDLEDQTEGLHLIYAVSEESRGLLPVTIGLFQDDEEVHRFELNDTSGEESIFGADEGREEVLSLRVLEPQGLLVQAEWESPGEEIALVISMEMIRARPVLQREESLPPGSITAEREARREREQALQEREDRDRELRRSQRGYLLLPPSDILVPPQRREGREGQERRERPGRIEAIERRQERQMERYRRR